MHWDSNVPGYRITVADMVDGLTYQALFGTQVLGFARNVKKGDVAATRAALLQMKELCEQHQVSGSSSSEPEPRRPRNPSR